jgi:TonB family protein
MRGIVTARGKVIHLGPVAKPDKSSSGTPHRRHADSKTATQLVVGNVLSAGVQDRISREMLAPYAEPQVAVVRAAALFRLSRMEGQFAVHQFDTTKRYDTLKGHLDEYLADWINAGAPKSEQVVHIADFYFIDGRFRWNSGVAYFPFQKPNKRSMVPEKLVTKIQPDYPAEARDHGIEGTVKLQIIVRKDGSVTVQNVLPGDPALSPAAIEAVRQWRYQPARLDGQLIEMQTTVEVNFALKP